jgi:hypothetical protein
MGAISAHFGRGMSQNRGFLFLGKSFSRFWGVQQNGDGMRVVPKSGFLVSGKSFSRFWGVQQNGDEMHVVPKSGFLVSGKKLFTFLGGHSLDCV